MPVASPTAKKATKGRPKRTLRDVASNEVSGVLAGAGIAPVTPAGSAGVEVPAPPVPVGTPEEESAAAAAASKGADQPARAKAKPHPGPGAARRSVAKKTSATDGQPGFWQRLAIKSQRGPPPSASEIDAAAEAAKSFAAGEGHCEFDAGAVAVTLPTIVA